VTSEQARLEAIVAHASEYELPALLKALFACGFDWESLRFEGIRELNPPRGGLVRGVYIEPSPRRMAVLRLNAGLLSRSSPLPDYFIDFARRLPDPDAFVQFLGFWDSVQLRAFAYATFPSLSVGRGRALAQAYRARIRLLSPMSLHCLFRSAFPELRVQVVPTVFAQSSRSGRARLGATLDGRLVIGADFTERCAGFRIRLCVESLACEGVLDWEETALQRIARLEPTLARSGKPLEVVMGFDEYRHGQRLVARDGKRRQLGVRPWLHPERDKQLAPGDVILRAAWPG
jgi:hypothetical protein